VSGVLEDKQAGSGLQKAGEHAEKNSHEVHP